MKKPQQSFNRHILNLTRSPKHFKNDFITEDEFKETSVYQGGDVSDGFLDSNRNANDPSFTGRKHRI